MLKIVLTFLILSGSGSVSFNKHPPNDGGAEPDLDVGPKRCRRMTNARVGILPGKLRQVDTLSNKLVDSRLYFRILRGPPPRRRSTPLVDGRSSLADRLETGPGILNGSGLTLCFLFIELKWRDGLPARDACRFIDDPVGPALLLRQQAERAYGKAAAEDSRDKQQLVQLQRVGLGVGWEDFGFVAPEKRRQRYNCEDRAVEDARRAAGQE